MTPEEKQEWLAPNCGRDTKPQEPEDATLPPWLVSRGPQLPWFVERPWRLSEAKRSGSHQ